MHMKQIKLRNLWETYEKLIYDILFYDNLMIIIWSSTSLLYLYWTLCQPPAKLSRPLRTEPGSLARCSDESWADVGTGLFQYSRPKIHSNSLNSLKWQLWVLCDRECSANFQRSVQRLASTFDRCLSVQIGFWHLFFHVLPELKGSIAIFF